jgi:hypothetical protein
VTAAFSELAEREPPPAGDQVVLWAQPRRRGPPIKVRAAKSRSAACIGEARGPTAIATLPDSGAKGPGACRQWLAAVPTGYICTSDATLQAGYASAPPAVESATSWQRYRYGMVTAKTLQLRNGSGRYLRDVLHRGDGVTVVRETSSEAQLIGRQWLPRKDVELATPSTLAPLYLDTLPPGARPAWVVPATGETQAPAFAAGGGETGLPWVAMLPRYSLVMVEGSPLRPGRVLVQLPEPTRAALKAYPEAQNARAVEVDAALLRRWNRVEPPPEVGPEERWIDIALGDQVAAAYTGKTPLFATLISTGKDDATPPGSFFIYRKYLTQTMANQRGAAAQYDYREVPHAQFFNGRIGLHAVLWHDSLGQPVSHGCVNLSPAAALQFFAFSAPQLPGGWHSITANSTSSESGGASPLLGTRVVVRR